MTLNLEDNGFIITDVDHARVFAWTDNDARARCRKRLKVNFGAFVGAVFRKKSGTDTKLDHVNRAAECLNDAIKLLFF